MTDEIEKSAHTQGPWYWVAGISWDDGPDEGEACLQNAAGDIVIASRDGRSLCPSEADAALIASAPDLLKENALLKAENALLKVQNSIEVKNV